MQVSLLKVLLLFLELNCNSKIVIQSCHLRDDKAATLYVHANEYIDVRECLYRHSEFVATCITLPHPHTVLIVFI